MLRLISQTARVGYSPMRPFSTPFLVMTLAVRGVLSDRSSQLKPASAIQHMDSPSISKPRQFQPAHSFPKTPKPPVRFNLDKLSKLSGWEKVELFRDFVKNHMPLEALAVYERLRVNNIIHQLTYQDHHAMFHLLLANPVVNREPIGEIVGYMIQRNMKPSESFWMSYIHCCSHKWRDMEHTMWAFNQMLDNNIKVSTVTWNDVLNMHAYNQKDLQMLMEGVKIWERMDSQEVAAQPDLETYLCVMDLYGRLARVTDAEGIYQRALNELSDLVHRSRQLTAVSDRQKKKLMAIKVERDMAVRLLNGMLGVYAHSGHVAKGLKLADAILQHGVMNDVDMTSQSTAQSLYSLLLKLCVQSKDLSSALKYMDDAKRRGVRVDAVMVGRLVHVHGFSGDLQGAKQVFDAALTQLQLDKQGNRWQDLHTAYLQAIVVSGDISSANKWFFGEYQQAFPKEKRLLRMVYNLMIEANRDIGNNDVADKIDCEMQAAYRVEIPKTVCHKAGTDI
ncbi:hypothetical protein O5D80_002723 [Batrachochytrium dendrobatidis]|nr:hypothetical protein O5D80_002723 [Batrachochytrium dendrobatidis]